VRHPPTRASAIEPWDLIRLVLSLDLPVAVTANEPYVYGLLIYLIAHSVPTSVSKPHLLATGAPRIRARIVAIGGIGKKA
jgi:hypothetical protein